MRILPILAASVVLASAPAALGQSLKSDEIPVPLPLDRSVHPILFSARTTVCIWLTNFWWSTRFSFS
jgi:hypothetical protein